MHPLLIALIAAAGAWVALIAILALMGRRTAARELATLVPTLARFFADLLRDPRVPRRAKILLGIGALWIASPIDLIPEFIPILGPLDDAVVAALVLRYVLRRTDQRVLVEHWHGGETTLRVLLHVAGRPGPSRNE